MNPELLQELARAVVQAKRPDVLMQEPELLKDTEDLNPAELRAVAEVFERWSRQLHLVADLKGGQALRRHFGVN